MGTDLEPEGYVNTQWKISLKQESKHLSLGLLGRRRDWYGQHGVLWSDINVSLSFVWEEWHNLKTKGIGGLHRNGSKYHLPTLSVGVVVTKNQSCLKVHRWAFGFYLFVFVLFLTDRWGPQDRLMWKLFFDNLQKWKVIRGPSGQLLSYSPVQHWSWEDFWLHPLLIQREFVISSSDLVFRLILHHLFFKNREKKNTLSLFFFFLDSDTKATQGLVSIPNNHSLPHAFMCWLSGSWFLFYCSCSRLRQVQSILTQSSKSQPDGILCILGQCFYQGGTQGWGSLASVHRKVLIVISLWDKLWVSILLSALVPLKSVVVLMRYQWDLT